MSQRPHYFSGCFIENLTTNLIYNSYFVFVGQVVNITLNHWTSKQGFNSVGMSAHWIDDNWNLQSVPLGIFLYEGTIAADAVLRKFICNIENEFLTGTVIVFAVTTDTDPTINLFGELLEAGGIIHVYFTDHLFHTTCKQCYLHDNYGDSCGANAIQQATGCVSFLINPHKL